MVLYALLETFRVLENGNYCLQKEYQVFSMKYCHTAAIFLGFGAIITF